MLEGTLIDASTEDTGADATVVPDKVVAKMEQRGLAVERIKLKKARALRLPELTAPRLLAEKKIIVKRLTCQVMGVSIVFRNATLFVRKTLRRC
jgi:hypothetical protein